MVSQRGARDQLMPTYAQVLPALKWRCGQLSRSTSPLALAAALTVSELPYASIPAKIWPSVRAFRRLRSDVRINAARKYLHCLLA